MAFVRVESKSIQTNPEVVSSLNLDNGTTQSRKSNPSRPRVFLLIDDEVVALKPKLKVKDVAEMWEDEVNNARDPDVVDVQETTELGQALEHLNKDEIQKGTRMSGIDMRANLHPFELSSVLAIDSLVALRAIPLECMVLTRQKKRLSVSALGKGRNDIIKIVSGKYERDSMKNGSLFDRVANVFKPNQEGTQ